MKWTIQQIKDQSNQLLNLNENINVKEALMLRYPEIIEVKDTNVKGYYTVVNQEVLLHATVETDITLPSTRTLEPVTIHLSFPIKERYVKNSHETNLDEHEEITIVLEDETLHLDDAVIDHILLNIPLKIIGEEELNQALPSGNDWTVMTEEDYLAKQQEDKPDVDPRLSVLKNLLKDQTD